jgi:hypothetical protein
MIAHDGRKLEVITAKNATGQTSRLLPLSIHLVPPRVAFHEVHAQQTPARCQLGFGFDAVGEKLEEVDEPGEQRKFHCGLLPQLLCPV